MSLVSRNLVWLLFSQLATWVMTLVAMLVVPRLLGAADLGAYGFAAAYVAFFALALGLGTSALTTRDVSRDHSLVAAYVWNGTLLKVALSTVVGGLAMVLAVLLDFSPEVLGIVAIGCVGLYVFSVNEVLAGALTGLQRMGKSSAWLVASAYAGNIGGIVVLMAGGGVVLYALVLFLASILPLLGNWLLLRRMVKGHGHFDGRLIRHLVRAGVPLMLLMVFNQIYGTIDIPVLAALSTPTVVGWYVLAYRWASIPVFIATVVTGSFYPEMSRLGPQGGREFADLVNRALKLVLVVAIPAAVGLAVIADDLLHLLYGTEFSESVVPLQILALQIPITCVDTILATGLIAQNRLRKYLVVAGVTAALNPLVTLGLVALTQRVYDNGAIGAALATALTEVFVMTVAVAMSASGVMDRAMVGWTLRCLLAGAAVGGAVVALRSTPVVVQVVAGVVAYVLASFALRSITPGMVREGIDQVSGAVRRRPVEPVQPS